MVDVSDKPVTVRQATAVGDVILLASTAQSIQRGEAKKGDVLGIARLAAIQATKCTSQLIPLCHAIPIEAVSVRFEWIDPPPKPEVARLRCLVTVRTSAKTGVEMEAMTGVTIACLTVYDMMKSVDREISIRDVQLIEKSGGKSGVFRRRNE